MCRRRKRHSPHSCKLSKGRETTLTYKCKFTHTEVQETEKQEADRRFLGRGDSAESESYIVSRSVLSDSLQPYGLQPTRLLCPWDSPGKNTGMGSHALLRGIFLTQGSNLSLLHCRRIPYRLSHRGSPGDARIKGGEGRGLEGAGLF